MPPLPMMWRHITCHTKNSWLHGDPRGFRDRGHRRHSTGDHHNPPPSEEHEGLRRWYAARAGDAVALPRELRPIIVKAFVERLIKEGSDVLVASCSETHVHALATAPVAIAETKQMVGQCKRNACGAVYRQMPGSLWAADGGYKPVHDESHRENAYRYISTDQEAGTLVWTKDGREYWMS